MTTRSRWGLLILLLVAQMLYTPINRLADGGVALALSLDLQIPLAPNWAFPYLLGIPWWFGTFVWACFWFPAPLLRRFAGAVLASHVIAYSIYLIFPTFAVRPEVMGEGLGSDLVRWIYANDRAYNAFPSGHTYGTLLALLAWWRAVPRMRWAVTPFAVAVILSTLFTRQHHVADVLGGLALGWAAWVGVGWALGRWAEARPVGDRVG